MRSPLEHEPDLVAGIGLITVRWALLEDQLSRLLEPFATTPAISRSMYYSLGSFAQRLNLVATCITEGVKSKEVIQFSEILFRKVRRLWQARNALIHSHYVYEALGEDGLARMRTRMEGEQLAPETLPPREPFMATLSSTDGKKLVSIKFSGGKFGYEKGRSAGDPPQFKPVNKSTFANHAAEVSRRIRDTTQLQIGIRTGVLPSLAPKPGKKGQKGG